MHTLIYRQYLQYLLCYCSTRLLWLFLTISRQYISYYSDWSIHNLPIEKSIEVESCCRAFRWFPEFDLFSWFKINISLSVPDFSFNFSHCFPKYARKKLTENKNVYVMFSCKNVRLLVLYKQHIINEFFTYFQEDYSYIFHYNVTSSYLKLDINVYRKILSANPFLVETSLPFLNRSVLWK